jgi:hypothetical protein
VKAAVKSQGGEGEDPDSRMDSERTDRRDKKGGKGKVGDWQAVKVQHADTQDYKLHVFKMLNSSLCFDTGKLGL